MTAVINSYEQMTSGHYGSLGLKRVVGPNLLLGLLFSALAHSLVVATPLLLRFFQADAVPPPDDIITVDASTLVLQSHQPANQPVQIAQTQMSVSKVAIPIAVPEDEIPLDPAIVPSQTDLKHFYGPGGDTDLDKGTGPSIVVIEDSPRGEEIPKFGDFIPVEEMPQPLGDFYRQPDYPRMARQAGVQGRVIVQIYVDKSGRVKKHNIVSARPDNLGFQEEVEKVVDDWRFTPAIQDGKPVGVWIELPVNFTISN